MGHAFKPNAVMHILTCCHEGHPSYMCFALCHAGVPPKRFRSSKEDNVNDLQGVISRSLSSIMGRMSKIRSRKSPNGSESKMSPTTVGKVEEPVPAADKLPV